MLIAWLAIRDMMKEPLVLLGNVFVLVGVLLPFLVLLGVKNGVYGALVGELLADPSARQIDTQGNGSFSNSRHIQQQVF